MIYSLTVWIVDKHVITDGRRPPLQWPAILLPVELWQIRKSKIMLSQYCRKSLQTIEFVMVGKIVEIAYGPFAVKRTAITNTLLYHHTD
jgi:hypothetical protein